MKTPTDVLQNIQNNCICIATSLCRDSAQYKLANTLSKLISFADSVELPMTSHQASLTKYVHKVRVRYPRVPYPGIILIRLVLHPDDVDDPTVPTFTLLHRRAELLSSSLPAPLTAFLSEPLCRALLVPYPPSCEPCKSALRSTLSACLWRHSSSTTNCTDSTVVDIDDGKLYERLAAD